MAKPQTTEIKIPGCPIIAVGRNSQLVGFKDEHGEEITADEIAKRTHVVDGNVVSLWEYWMSDFKQWQSRVAPLPPMQARIVTVDSVAGLRNLVTTLRNNGCPDTALEPIVLWINDEEAKLFKNVG